jgi:hypothetical protein
LQLHILLIPFLLSFFAVVYFSLLPYSNSSLVRSVGEFSKAQSEGFIAVVVLRSSTQPANYVVILESRIGGFIYG